MAQRIEITPLIVGTEVLYSGIDSGTPSTVIVDTANLVVDAITDTSYVLPYEARKLVNQEYKGITVDEFRKQLDGVTNNPEALIQSRVTDNSSTFPRIYYVQEDKATLLAAIIAN